jgi:hypothetical protein
MSVKKPGWHIKKIIIIEALFHNVWKSYIPAIIRFQASTQCTKLQQTCRKKVTMCLFVVARYNQSCRNTNKKQKQNFVLFWLVG